MKILIPTILFFASSSYAAFLPKSFEADFADIRGETQIPVTIKYSFPKKIHYEVKGDAPLLYVCNEQKTWKYTPPFIEGEKGELAVGDSAQFCYSRIFDSLAKGLESNDIYSVSKQGKMASLNFNEAAQKQLGLERIEISFSEKADEKTTLADATELRMFLSNKPEPVRLALKKFNENPSFSKSQFSFSAPKNTNVIEMK